MNTKLFPGIMLFLSLIGSCHLELVAQTYNTGRTTIVNGATGTIKSGEYNSSIVIGEPFVLSTKGLNNSTSTGLWGLQLNSPSSPNISASEGDFSDKVEITWQLESLSPAPGKGYHVFRDGNLLARLSFSDTSYTDSNVKAGVFYFYTITAINNFGESVLGNTTGFVNPNGVITGTIETSKKRPVSDVEVSLSPVVGRSLSFDGSDDKLDAVSSEVSTLNSLIDTSFTFSMWVNPSSTGTDRMLGGGQFQDVSGESYPFALYTSGDKFAASLTTSFGEQLLTGTTTFITSQWYHVVLTYSTSKGVQLLVDGNIEADASTNGSLEEFISFLIGEDINSTSGLARWDGLIDEIRLWDIHRDTTSIQTDKDRTISGKTENLIGYWRLDEGTGDLAFDLTSQKIKLNIEGASFSTTHATLPASAITDSLGNYEIEGIFYDTGTTFDVTPTKALHTFTPSLRNATLSTSNTGVNNVDFEDDSQISVEGFVKFSGTECFEQEVEILVNGNSTIPKTFTDSNGEFTLEFEPGTSVTIGPSKNDHPFSPINYVIENINEPLAGVEFKDNDLVDLSIHFAGGACRYPIGKATVTVRTLDGCFSQTFETDASGFAVLRNIPSNKYEVILTPEDPNITFDGIEIDLSAGSDTVEFIYRAPLEAEIELLTNTRHVNDIPVLRMAAEGQDTTLFKMILREEYKNSTTGALNYCYIDSGTVKIDDKIALKETNRTITFKNPDITRKDSMPVYKMIVGRPNFLDGGERPYQKELQITGKDVDGREATGEFWAYVQGHQTVGNSFITTAPNRPLFVLRDPPGDKSFSEITKEYTLTYANSFEVKLAEDREFETVEVGGIDEIEGEGVLIETLEQVRDENQVGSKTTYGVDLKSRKTITFEEVLKTDESAESADGKHDIIAGAAHNYRYGVVQSLRVNDDGSVEISKRLGIEPDGFQTFYYYTVGFIEEVLIPNLKQTPDFNVNVDIQKEVENWERHLEFHNQLTSQNFLGLLNIPQVLPDQLFKNNISFSAGAPYEAIAGYQSVSSIEWEDEIEIKSEVTDDIITTVAGSGEGFKTKLKTTYSEDSEREIEFEGSTETRIVLDDATEGDAFSVDIETDVLGFPLYKLKGGQSTNPWEENTSKRDNVSLTMDSYQAVNVPPTGEAQFTLNIGNESETDEERVYEVRLIPESNPDGAVLKVGGKALPATNSFTIPAGETVQASLTVERGPEAFEYDSLMLMAYAPGQYDLWLSTENRHFLDAVDTVFFNVQFSKACGSDVAIANFNNFVINQYDSTAFPVQVFGYNPNDPDFDQLLLEYQHAGEDFWIIADSVRSDSIGIQDFYFMSWDYNDLADGAFNLRVKSVCVDGTVSESNHLNGIIDRSSPTIFGELSPANNGSLGFNQEIAITFNERIDTTTLFVDQIRLFNTEEDREIPMRFSTDGFTIILTPEEQNRFIEGVRLRAEIDTLADIHGNWISSPIEWEFEVDRNPIRWNQKTLSEAVFTDITTVFSIPLRNIGQQTSSFTLTNIPDWISVTPVEGEIGANGKVDIQLSITDEINFGQYFDTLTVETSEGDEPLQLDIRALQRPPIWQVEPLDFEYQMSVVGEVVLKGTPSSDSFDIVAAFVDGECRGFASPQLVEETGQYLLFLNLYSNVQNGEEITFRLWDAEDAEEYWELNDSFSFEANTVMGSLSSPIEFNSEGDVAQHVTLNKGWTWFTEHLTNTEEKSQINNALSGISFGEGDRIISQSRFESWSTSGNRWVPGKMQFSSSETYHINTDSAKTITFIGQEIDPDAQTITLTPGNTWIGYPIRRNVQINTALANLNATEGSVIRNQTQFAEYLGGNINQWIGSLNLLRAGDGFIYTSTSDDTLSFSYNTGSTNQKIHTNSENQSPVKNLPVTKGIISSQYSQKEAVESRLKWELSVYEHQYNMPVILGFDEIELDSSWVVGAFINDEIAGIGRLNLIPLVGEYRSYLMVYHSIATADSVSFKLLNPESEEIIGLNNKVIFSDTHHTGSLLAPVRQRAVLDSEIPTEFSLSQNYPNPFNPSTTLNVSLPIKAHLSIVIYNILGQKVATIANEELPAGIHYIQWDTSALGLSSGVYFAEMKADKFTQIRKMTLIK
ncbi:MAG: T9SS C-terminal target domain-containing protein [Balneola sp.]|nr:MAG: T9SS C-terminal target domain-containing protein [Balneola sp.]